MKNFGNAIYESVKTKGALAALDAKALTDNPYNSMEELSQAWVSGFMEIMNKINQLKNGDL